MEGVNRNVDWSSKELMDMFTYSDDEVDIVGEGEIDDVEEEPYVETSLPYVHVEPNDECSELSRLEWVNSEVVLLSESGVHVAEDVHRNNYMHDCVDQYPLGDEDVGVVIL